MLVLGQGPGIGCVRAVVHGLVQMMRMSEVVLGHRIRWVLANLQLVRIWVKCKGVLIARDILKRWKMIAWLAVADCGSKDSEDSDSLEAVDTVEMGKEATGWEIPICQTRFSLRSQ